MYSDRNLEFCIASRDAAAEVTRALPLGQADLAAPTDGMGPLGGLYLHVSAGEAVAAPASSEQPGFTVTLEHCDTKDGTFTAVVAFPEIRTAITKGQALVKHPVPQGIRNWVRLRFSAAKLMNAVMTLDAEKHYPGLFRE
ncbi:MAG: hypothetical protein LBL73_00170 [Synergistaceae bacterium]|jgi:hypothetical protein|nr:hypothetical protein [Synergistaceae bacterium]